MVNACLYRELWLWRQNLCTDLERGEKAVKSKNITSQGSFVRS